MNAFCHVPPAVTYRYLAETKVLTGSFPKVHFDCVPPQLWLSVPSSTSEHLWREIGRGKIGALTLAGSSIPENSSSNGRPRQMPTSF
nr:hypothetical protein CFP56_29998 [Quercus suber]